MNIGEYVQPMRKYAPVYAWTWNDRVDREGIMRDLTALRDAGAGGVYVIPLPPEFRPGFMNTYLEPEYLSDEYFEMLAFAEETARKLGLDFWMYDEGGWPSGYANGKVVQDHPEFARSRLGGAAPGRLADPLNPDATRRFIESAYRPCFDRIPSLKMAFTDEPSAGNLPWPREFDRLFSEEEQAALKDEGRDDEFARITRIRYRKTCGRFFRENYMDILRNFCRERGAEFTGHLDHDHFTLGCNNHGYGNVLEVLRGFDVPGIDVIWRQIDLRSADPGNRFFPRFAASAAAQNGTVRVLTESFAVYGADITGEDMRWCINAQLSRGINVFNFMHMPYGRRGMLGMAMRPSFRPETPGFYHLKGIHDFCARACRIMQTGVRRAKNALYFPLEDILAGGETASRAAAEFDRLGQEMERLGVDFDITDEENVHRYEYVTVPENRYCPRPGGKNWVRDLVTDCPDLRAYFRELEGGERLAYIFNESSQTVSVHFETEFRWVMQPETGYIRPAEKTETFLAGEGRVYIQGSVEGIRPDPERICLPVDGFETKPIRGFGADRKGIHAFVPEKAEFDGVFSGEIAYIARVELPFRPTGECVLRLGRVECSAEVRIDGETVGYAFCAPMEIRFPACRLSGKHCTLEIRVANTAANAIAAADLPSLFAPEDMGAYPAMTIEEEKKAAAGGLYGPVTLWIERPEEDADR